MNPWAIKARSFARRTGLIKTIVPFKSYDVHQKRIHETLERAVRPGDVVWDVGANVGACTELFCRWVGENGLVVAFEPCAESCQQIRERLPDCMQLLVENVALGEDNVM
jgi:ubiquinone/menaquinone biosynthesis C-methylase UbiE